MNGAKRRVSKWVVGTGIAGTVFIACGAFWLSFTALTHLAVASGIDSGQAWAWPLIVDGIIVVATVSVVALAGRKDVWYPWLLLMGGAVVSVTANAIQAAMSDAVTVPHPMAGAVASVPPIVLLAITHLTVVLTRPEEENTREITAVRVQTEPSTSLPMQETSPTLPASPASATPEQVEEPTPASTNLLSLFALGVGDTDDEDKEVAAQAVSGQSGERSRTWEVERAKQLRSEGMSFRAIGTELGRDGTTIARWLRDENEPEPGGTDA